MYKYSESVAMYKCISWLRKLVSLGGLDGGWLVHYSEPRAEIKNFGVKERESGGDICTTVEPWRIN